MHLILNKLSLSITLRSIITLVLISFISIGGCNDNNNGDSEGGGLGATETSCTAISSPCDITSINDNNKRFECTSLSNGACAVDLEDVVAQVDPDSTKVNNNTIMWIEAWGGKGGSSDKGADGGNSGYAVTTTTIDGIKNKNSGSSTIYYFLGTPGVDGPERCAGGGGVATIVTTEDLVLNPDSNPTQEAPPILLVAGGSGSGAAANKVGFCLTSTSFNGGDGGIAIASTSEAGQGAGGSSSNKAGESFGTGGNQDGKGSAGTGSASSSEDGTSGYGGRGGVGGSGSDCGGRAANNFSNTPVELTMTTGKGGNGGSADGSCAAGGGAGGGGYGGGGGGNHGNESIAEVGGAGGGSFAIKSTHSSDKSPTTRQTNPCGADNGCVRITFYTE